MSDVPQGFHPFDTQSPFIKSVGPLYIRADDDLPRMGLMIERKHCNSRGRLHGGMVSTLADIAMGQRVARAFSANGAFEDGSGVALPGVGMATVTMSVDFAGTARVGSWIEVDVDIQRAGKRMAFANAYLVHAEARIARVSGVYQVIGAGK